MKLGTTVFPRYCYPETREFQCIGRQTGSQTEPDTGTETASSPVSCRENRFRYELNDMAFIALLAEA